MKKIKLFSTFLVTMFLAACGGSNDGGDDITTSTEYLNVTSQIAIAGDGTQKGVLQISADCAWTISGNPSWMTLSDNSGSGNATVEITCRPNPSSSDERSAVINVTSASGKIKKPVTVTQGISKESITINADELTFANSGESKILVITSNTEWRISGVEDWFTLSRTEGTGNSDITITVKKNEQETVRTATLTIQGANASRRVVIRQEAYVTTLSVSPSVINAAATTESYELTLEGDATWTASINVDWCTLNKLNGVGNEKLKVNVKDNINISAREASITFIISQGEKVVSVKQSGGTVPTINNLTINDVQRYSFQATANYSSDFAVTEYGVCYSETNTLPDINDTKTSEDGNNKSGSLTINVESLKSGKTYYVRAYAKSVVGIGYSDPKTVKTSGSKPNNDDNVKPQI